MQADLQNLLQEAVAALASTEPFAELSVADARPERTRDPRHGDFSSNLAMRLAGPLGMAPRELAQRIVDALPASGLVERVEIAGPGFINFTLSPQAYRAELLRILTQGADYGTSDTGTGVRVLLEYVSANPTGPLHVGHGRHAAYGCTLANLLRATGYDVDEEYYVNDAGRQMDVLAASVWLRYAALCGHDIGFPAKAYQGAYCIDVAAKLHDTHGHSLLGDPDSVKDVLAGDAEDPERQLDELVAATKSSIGADSFAIVHQAVLDHVLSDIRNDLEEFGIRPQRWYSERSLLESSAVRGALDELTERGVLYEKDGATWFATTRYGDDKDRVVVRENGATTYFASDIAYHREKCQRGYDKLLNVLGSDHHGYIARLRAGLEALGKPGECLEVRLVQFVVLYRGAEKVQMATRTAEYVTMRELREEVGNDAARFFYVSRSNDQHLDFDLELAKSQSNDNPVYYVQYAHARISSMLGKLQDEGSPLPAPSLDAASPLTAPAEKSLLTALSRYPEVVEHAAANRAPQTLVQYLRDLAAEFHSYYNSHRVLVEETELRDARVLLAMGVRQVLRNALSLLGVSAPDSM